MEESKYKTLTDEELLEDEEIDEEIDSNTLMAYDIAVFYNTYNLATLLKWWEKQKLIVPVFQRSFVWNEVKASEFVDSMLRGLPVPSLFFYDDIDNSRYLVVDGLQRMLSLYSFIHEKKFSGKPFKLVGNIHPKWRGKTFDELEQVERDRLEDALMNITVMRQLAPDDGQSSMYLAFQRLNTGGITLKAQEIRMAISYGPFAEYLQEISKDLRFDKWGILRTKDQISHNNFSRTQEFILKFFTYYFMFDSFSGSSTRNLIDTFFDEQKDFDKPKRKKPGHIYHSREEFHTVFNAVLDIILSLSNDDISPYNKPTQTFLESIWVGLTYRKLIPDKDINRQTLSKYIKGWKDAIGDDKFKELFQARRTSSISSAYDRIKAGIEYFSGDF